MKHRTLFTLVGMLCVHIAAGQAIDWTPVGPGGGSDLMAMAVQPDDADIVYVGGDIEGMFKTVDGGITWHTVTDNLAGQGYGLAVLWTQDLVIDPHDPSYQTIYAANLVGVFRSTTGGGDWQRLYPTTIDDEEDYEPIGAVAVDADDPDRLYAGIGVTVIGEEEGAGRLVRSEDGGTSWEVLDPGFASPYTVFDIRAPGGGLVLVTTDKGLARSLDSGGSFTQVSAGLPHTDLREVHVVGEGPDRTMVMTAATHYQEGVASSFSGGIFISEDDGLSWRDATGDLPRYDPDPGLFYDYRHVAPHPSDPDRIYTSPARGSGWDRWGIYRTDDAGASWKLVDGPIADGWLDQDFFDERFAHVMRTAPSDGQTVYVGLDWVRKSTDGGASWQEAYTERVDGAWRGTGLELMNVDGIWFHPSDPDRVYVAYDDNGPFVSNDGGVSFRPLDATQDPFDGYDGAKEVLVDPRDGRLLVSRFDGSMNSYNAGFVMGGVWASSDGGDSWNRLSGLPEGRPHLLMDVADPSVLYCAIYTDGILRSTDGGDTWSRIDTGLGSDAGNVWVLAQDPAAPGNLFAGVNRMGGGGGLYASVNGGATWVRLPGFPDYDVHDIVVTPGGRILASATDNWEWGSDGGVFASDDGGITWMRVLDEVRITDLDVDPTDGERILAASSAWWLFDDGRRVGVHLSGDGGARWQWLGTPPHPGLNAVRFNPHAPSELWVATAGGGVWRGQLSATASESPPADLRGGGWLQVYPNPFRESVTVRFGATGSDRYTIQVFDLLGQIVAELHDGPLTKPLTWRPDRTLAPGVYLIRSAGSAGTTWSCVVRTR